MTKLKGKIALVTGASSGIGAATATKLAEAGAKVGIAARRADKLEDLKTKIEPGVVKLWSFRWTWSTRPLSKRALRSLSAPMVRSTSS